MGFQVKYEEITSIRELILAQLDRWIEQIDAVRCSIVEIATMPEMHGEAAEHVRSYMWDYHMNLANMIKDTIETYRSSFILYTDWYYNIDSDQMAEMSQDSMEGLEENIQGARSDFDAVAEEVADIERELSAYLDVGRFSTTCMESCFDNALAGVQNVRTQIGEYEEAHSHADMYPIDMMVGYLRSIIGGQLGGSSATISAYDASVVNATESFQLAQMMDGMLSTYLEQVKDRVNSCEEFYELQQQQWQESIRLRTEEGIVKTLVGVGTMILGGMLVVATCGMALPLVATVGVMAIGAGTAAYGFSNTVEGGQDVYAGVTGDPRMVSVNPIRDTVFASNPELYYLIGNVLTIAASLILTGGMAANAAVSAGTSIGRAVVTEYAKQGLTVAASSYMDKRMTEATNSPLAGFVVGSLTGMATYGTLSELDSMANVSGLHSSFAEGMSKEDAQKYLDFLENGSKEGLTEAEIRGIGKVDEALALKKVNPEELLELRKQQLGNVGETSYGKSTLNSLKNTENFTDSAIEHIFEGQVNARGKAVGYHYEGIEGTSGNVIPGTESSTNNFGIYKAKVEVNGIPKTANGGFSTFYSKNLSPQQVVDAINEAYSNCELKLGTRNTYQGVANNGMKIDMFLDQSGKIISAFPEE
ncbi:EndoU domain-containing protein [Roseburia sp. AF02-12]|uniref:EndoU domain-containing protein n=9 Tax=Roseburia TaxID=841 RepID=UPI0018F6AC92|nr:EndoU domain-containing protein [Roseburia sp. AF02-12]